MAQEFDDTSADDHSDQFRFENGRHSPVFASAARNKSPRTLDDENKRELVFAGQSNVVAANEAWEIEMGIR
jgi:hypothetical protein